VSEQMRASEYKCPTCGRLDPFNQTIEDALRAEVEALKAKNAGLREAMELQRIGTIDIVREELDRLQAELAKYTGPLNNRQREAISKAMRVQNNPNMTKWDAAIRAAREGER